MSEIIDLCDSSDEEVDEIQQAINNSLNDSSSSSSSSMGVGAKRQKVAAPTQRATPIVVKPDPNRMPTAPPGSTKVAIKREGSKTPILVNDSSMKGGRPQPSNFQVDDDDECMIYTPPPVARVVVDVDGEFILLFGVLLFIGGSALMAFELLSGYCYVF